MKIYMFHYVSENFPYYHFDINLFEKKLEDILKNNVVISLKDYQEIINNNKEKDKNYVMLTFDDGTADHYNNVYKILKKHNCSGLFFLPSCSFNKKILTIQILHRLLSLGNFEEVYKDFLLELDKINYDIKSITLNKTLDDNKTAIFKQALQYKLPKKIRKKIINKLIRKYNISTNTDNYYINIKELKEMKENGMYFGLHTNSHPNLELLSYNEQYKEINNNLKYLKKYNLVEPKLLSIAYPYGLYNEDTIKVLKQLNIKYGFKAKEDSNKSLYEIDRIDCNRLKEKINE